LLDLLGLQGLAQRYPHQLSGGQRQRLALARALAPAPQVVLLDEPFSNLDVEVRLLLRSELASVLQVCGASGLLVTHDPGEALAICDRVAVMRDGVLHQCATPRDLGRCPCHSLRGAFCSSGESDSCLARGRQPLALLPRQPSCALAAVVEVLARRRKSFGGSSCDRLGA
jgi:iron(III) transport system ATP-binding protein